MRRGQPDLLPHITDAHFMLICQFPYLFYLIISLFLVLMIPCWNRSREATAYFGAFSAVCFRPPASLVRMAKIPLKQHEFSMKLSADSEFTKFKFAQFLVEPPLITMEMKHDRSICFYLLCLHSTYVRC